MAKFRTQKPSDYELFQQLGPRTTKFLKESDEQILWLLDDSRKLYELHKNNVSEYEDYTFITTSAFKALEKWMFLIAEPIGISVEKIKDVYETKKSVGSLYRDPVKVSGVFQEILDKLESPEMFKNQAAIDVMMLQSLLKEYRHNLAHCWQTLEYPTEAQQKYMGIIISIKRITENLDDVGLI